MRPATAAPAAGVVSFLVLVDVFVLVAVDGECNAAYLSFQQTRDSYRQHVETISYTVIGNQRCNAASKNHEEVKGLLSGNV